MAPNKEYLLVVDYFLNQLIRCLGSKKNAERWKMSASISQSTILRWRPQMYYFHNPNLLALED